MTSRMPPWCVATLCSLSITAWAAPKPRKADKPKVAVMDFKAPANINRDLRDALSASIATTLDGTGALKAVSAAEIRAMLQLEEMRQAVGCEQSSCLAEIGNALGADYMLTGTILELSGSFTVQLQLLDSKSARVEGRVEREGGNTAKTMFEAARAATLLVVRDLLKRRSGRLLVVANEEGATVRLDGVIVGTTPLAPLEAPGGLHTVTLEKERFVRFSQDVEVAERSDKVVQAVLVPSVEYQRAFKAQVLQRRAIAGVVTGVGGAALIAGGALLGVRFAQSGRLVTEINDYNARPESERDVALGQQLSNRRRALGTLDALSVGLATAGVAALVVGVVLFVTNDRLDRYDLKTSLGKAAWIAPTGHGLALGF